MKQKHALLKSESARDGGGGGRPLKKSPSRLGDRNGLVAETAAAPPAKAPASKAIQQLLDGDLPLLEKITQEIATIIMSQASLAKFYGARLDDHLLAYVRQAAVKPCQQPVDSNQDAVMIDVYGRTKSSQAVHDEQSCTNLPFVFDRRFGIAYVVYWTLLLHAKARPPFYTYNVPPFNVLMLMRAYGISEEDADMVIMKLNQNGYLLKENGKAENADGKVQFAASVLFEASPHPLGRHWLNTWGKDILAGRSAACCVTPYDEEFYVSKVAISNVTTRLRFTQKNGVKPVALRALEERADRDSVPASQRVPVSVLTYFAPADLPGAPDGSAEAWSARVLESHLDDWGFVRVYTVSIDRNDLNKVGKAFTDHKDTLDGGIRTSVGKTPQNGQKGRKKYRVLAQLVY